MVQAPCKKGTKIYLNKLFVIVTMNFVNYHCHPICKYRALTVLKSIYDMCDGRCPITCEHNFLHLFSDEAFISDGDINQMFSCFSRHLNKRDARTLPELRLRWPKHTHQSHQIFLLIACLMSKSGWMGILSSKFPAILTSISSNSSAVKGKR